MRTIIFLQSMLICFSLTFSEGLEHNGKYVPPLAIKEFEMSFTGEQMIRSLVLEHEKFHNEEFVTRGAVGHTNKYCGHDGTITKGELGPASGFIKSQYSEDDRDYYMYKVMRKAPNGVYILRAYLSLSGSMPTFSHLIIVKIEKRPEYRIIKNKLETKYNTVLTYLGEVVMDLTDEDQKTPEAYLAGIERTVRAIKEEDLLKM